MKTHWSTLAALSLGGLLAIAQSAFAQAPTCNQVLTQDCLYFTSTRYAFTELERATTYQDIAGSPRTVKVLLRIPTGAPLPMPVVIWSHGGAEGKDNPRKSLANWSIATAEAGFLTVSIAHTPRDDSESRRQLCRALVPPLDDATCRVFKYLNWDRPHDIRAVLNELEGMNARGELRGHVDLLKIAVGGHSAGAGAALTVGGALRRFSDDPPGLSVLSDPRPIAFLAFSPQGPGSEGFFDTRFDDGEHSWKHIEKPALVVTGDGDSTCKPGVEPGSCIGDTPFGRRIAFGRMPQGNNKYHLYLHDAQAFHTLFALSTDKCSKPRIDVDQRKCDEIARWLKSTALAFLDASVRNEALAMQWLRSGNIVAASGSIAEWQFK
jgi:hypothetical protein